MRLATLLLSASFLLSAAPALGWGQKGHFMANEAAVATTPAPMPHFFHRSYPEIIAFANEPDQWRNGGPSLDSAESSDHYLDLEFVDGHELPVGRYRFVQLLVDEKILQRRGVRVDEVGFLPWRIAETAEMLEFQWRLWRRDDLAAFERPQVEVAIVRLSTALAHFVADAANPHHATIHFNGWLAENPHGYANDCEIHSRFETHFVTRAISTADVLSRIAPLQVRADYFSAAVELIRNSNGMVETLYRIDRDGGFEGAGTDEARELAASRIAAGASLMRDLWWSTWLNSAEPPRRR
jgi:hypothetical protein